MSATSPPDPTQQTAVPLSAEERRRGRRLAITSHPAGMTHRMVISDHLPTLALLALGASEGVVGLQRTLVYLGVLIQLPTLRRVGRIDKRRLLVAGQIVAILGTLPLLFFSTLESWGGSLGVGIALSSFAVAAAGFSIGETVWFPLLHGYQEDARTGRFFAILRTGWHFALILYFFGAQRWLASNPGAFGALFGVAFALGCLRVVLISRLPERSERTGETIHVREALRVLGGREIRRYLAGVMIAGSTRVVVTTFALVMMRRVIGFSDSRVLYTTVALYAGGLTTLWLWGRVVDAVGPEPVFRWTAVGLAFVFLGFLGVSDDGTASLGLAALLFFALHALSSGFDVADTHVLFDLAPADAPARTLVVARVTDSLVRGLSPLLAGIGLELLFASGLTPLPVYRGLFILCAVAILAAIVPLRTFRRAT
jgi:Na+/melibiose symporter-like transporter